MLKLNIKVTSYHSFCNFIDFKGFALKRQMTFRLFDLTFFFLDCSLFLVPLLSNCDIKHQGMWSAFFHNKVNSCNCKILNYLTSLQIEIPNEKEEKKNLLFNQKKFFGMLIQDQWNQLRILDVLFDSKEWRQF